MLTKNSFLWIVTAISAVLFHAPAIAAQEEHIDDLMSRMTLKEKVGQLNLPCVYVSQLGKDIPSKMEA